MTPRELAKTVGMTVCLLLADEWVAGYGKISLT